MSASPFAPPTESKQQRKYYMICNDHLRRFQKRRDYGIDRFFHVHNIIQQIYFAIFYLDFLHLFSKSKFIKISATLSHSQKTNFLFYYFIIPNRK